MSIKCVLFDLDGVLVDAADLHYEALNGALIDNGLRPIERQDHLDNFNGLATRVKIDILRDRGIPIDDSLERAIRLCKQDKTVDMLHQFVKPAAEKIHLIAKLKEYGMTLGCCTNAVRESLEIMLDLSLINDFFDLTLSNQDVENVKPHPEIYLKAMSALGVLPEETLIVEDSDRGYRAAKEAGAHVLRVEKVEEVNWQTVSHAIAKINYKDLQILIPMAGRGSRFRRVGYTLPKPLISVLGQPMIAHVAENLSFPGARWFFVALEDHVQDHELHTYLKQIAPGATVVTTDGITEGAACSAMLAAPKLDPDKPLMLANSDQYIEFDIYDFLSGGIGSDGAIMTFKSDHPKWSYAKVERGLVTQVKEKCVISDNATSGIYLWNRAGDFMDGVKDMIEANDRHNNEFYVAPSYNYCIKKGLKYRLSQIKRQAMWGLGTPEDLIKFVDHFEK